MLNTSRLSAQAYASGILAGDRVILARAITLVESELREDQHLAGEVLDAIMSRTGNSLRIGITGAPGVGKSTFIEAFGKTLIDDGRKIAVLTVDPSSQITGGSILGDKTRMATLARDTHAFIRPSPSGQTLGGVTKYTRETILLCEAAGFDTVIVETVGTGQSEIAIKNMVDFFLLLIQPGSGDELQGIKKGIVEMADAIAVTKADGENLQQAKTTQSEFRHALHLLQKQRSGWTPQVHLCSSLTQEGLPEIATMLEEYRKQVSATGFFQSNRRRQHVHWFREHFNYLLLADPKQFPGVTDAAIELERLITSGDRSARLAAHQLLQTYHDAVKRSGAPDL